VDCRGVPPFARTDLAQVQRAFAQATPVPLRQAWLTAPERDFAPAVVRTGWRTSTLLVFAELTDRDVFTRAATHNGRFWQLGDTFEMFLQPPGDGSYLELHVTPNNLRLQLRFARPPVPTDIDPFASALIREHIFESHTWARPDGWCVLAEIPMAAPALRFSFSRYDYTRGREHPVISSSSPHAQPAFHRPEEWGHLRCV